MRPVATAAAARPVVAPPTLWRRFLRRRSAVAALALLLLIALTCVGSLGWSGGRMRAPSFADARRPPSASHWLGTDDLGRDLLARTLYGGTISLGLGALAAAVAVAIGASYGLISGYVGGRCDEIMMRIVDVLYALPYLLLVMLLTMSLGAWLERIPLLPSAAGGGLAWRPLHPEWSRFVVLAFAIGGVSWLTMARVVRGQVLSLREQPFVEAARCLGLPTWRILLRHVLPNTVGPILVFASLTVPQAILQESFLSFLGVGVQAPQATWGSLAADGVKALNPIEFPWWQLVVPCTALSITLLALNYVGDGLRDAFDVRDRA